MPKNRDDISKLDITYLYCNTVFAGFICAPVCIDNKILKVKADKKSMRKRYAFIDLHRGWMLLLMVETHIFNSLLNPALKQEAWFSVLNFINGLIAPSFIFISGFAFFLASRYKAEDYRKFGWEFYRQIGRIVLILLTGYSLRMPHLSLDKLLTYWHLPCWQDFFSIDVLQCIAAGLVIMLIARMIIRSDRRYAQFLLSAAAVIIFVSPFIWQIDFARLMPIYFADYFNPSHGSLFPLFPWLAFMFTGGACSYYWKVSEDNESEHKFQIRLIYMSLIAIAVSCFILYFPPEFMHGISKLRPNAFFFLLRIGIILIMLMSLRFYELWKKTDGSLIIYAGRESLLVYWLHLQVIYRKLIGGRSINDIVAQGFGFWEAALSSILLCLVMVAAARLWSLTKKRYPLQARYAVISIVGLCIVYFILN